MAFAFSKASGASSCFYISAKDLCLAAVAFATFSELGMIASLSDSPSCCSLPVSLTFESSNFLFSLCKSETSSFNLRRSPKTWYIYILHSSSISLKFSGPTLLAAFFFVSKLVYFCLNLPISFSFSSISFYYWSIFFYNVSNIPDIF